MDDLNEEQRAAAAWAGDSAMVEAGPGGGKTKTLTARCLFELGRGREVNVLTFTVSAAEEIEKRLGEIAEQPAGKNLVKGRLAHVGTLHSWCLKYLRANGDERELVDEVTHLDLAEEVARRLRVSITMKRIRELMTGAQAYGLPERTYAQAVESTMAENRLVSYDGLLTGAIELLSGEGPGHRNETVFLIDEFQDSSLYDLQIYGMLHKGGAGLWCVGDLQQAIFSFRHAQTANVWGWAQYEELPVFELKTNYRSSKAVVKCCNVLNAGFVPRLEGVPREDAPAGAVVFFRDASVPSMMHRLRDRLQGLFRACPQTVPEEYAVLCRTNKECTTVRTYLEGEGIGCKTRRAEAVDSVPVHLWAAFGLFRHPDSDWMMKRFLRVMGLEMEGEQARAIKAGKPIAWLHYPALFAMDRTPGEWRSWMNFLQVPKEEQGWFFERVGVNWEINTWDEITMKLLERVQVEEAGTGVTVATVHMAKGREWRHVLMPYCDTESYRPKNGLEEERTFFVGASRAIETLSFFYCGQRQNEWQREPVKVDMCAPLDRLIQASNVAGGARKTSLPKRRK